MPNADLLGESDFTDFFKSQIGNWKSAMPSISSNCNDQHIDVTLNGWHHHAQSDLESSQDQLHRLPR
jgi:hypothetical protein